MADEYVPAGGWEAAGYTNFTPNYAQQTVQPTYNYNYDQQAANAAQPSQTLLNTPDSSYAAVRGWDPSPYAGGNTGPALQGGSWGGLLSDGYQYGQYTDPTVRGSTTPTSTLPGGDYNDQFNAPFGSQNPGGDYNDQFNAPYTNPYGDLPPAQYVDTSYQNPTQTYRMPDAPTGPNTYGGLSADAATGGAALGGYQPQPTYSDPAGGAQLGSYQPPQTYNDFATRGATMPGGYDPSYGTVGGAGVTNPYPVQPASPYGGLLGGADNNATYGNLSGSRGITNPADLPSVNARPISFDSYMNQQGYSMNNVGDGVQGWTSQSGDGQTALDNSTLANLRSQYDATAGAGLLGGPDNNPTYGSLAGVNRDQMRDAFTGGAGLQAGPEQTYGQPLQGVQYGGSQNAQPDLNQLPQTPSPAITQAGQDFGNIQYSSYPLDRSQVPTSVVPPGTQIGDLPYPNDAERMRLMRTINGEDPQNPDAILWSIQNRLATQQQPNEAPYGNTIGTGVGSNNNGTSVVTRGNQYNAFSQAGYNADNYANNVAGFNETNPNYQRYSDAIDRVWNNTAPGADPTMGATNYYNPYTSAPAWQQQLAQQNSQQIGAHTYVGQTPLYNPPVPPPRPDNIDPAPSGIPYAANQGFGGLLGGSADGENWYRDERN